MLMNRLKTFLPQSILKLIYNSLVQAVRLITCSKFNAHTEPLFKTLGLMKLFKLNVLSHNCNTRYGNIISEPKPKTSLGSQCIRYFLPKLIRDTAPEILEKVNTHSIHGFASYTKRSLLDKYSETCEIENCYICENN